MERPEFEKLMTVAIGRELAANRFYQAVASRAQNQGVKDVFTQLAKEELGHRDLLERFKADPAMALNFTAPAQDTKVAEATGQPALSIKMKPAEAVAVAMKREQAAVEFYRGLAKGSRDAEFRKVFEDLATMELGHKSRLENVYLEIGYPEAF